MKTWSNWLSLDWLSSLSLPCLVAIGLSLAVPLAAEAQSTSLGIRRSGGLLNLNQQMQIRLNNGTAGPLRDRADQLLRQGDLQQRQGAFAKALTSWEEALDLYSGISDYQGVGASLDLIAITQGTLGNYHAAEEAMRQRLGMARTRQDFIGQVYALNNLGTILLQGGTILNVDAAEPAFTEALTIAEDVGHLEGQGLSLSNLGLTAFAKAEFGKAVKLYETSLKFRRQTDNPIGEANTLNNLGDAYWALDNYSDAIGAYGEALNTARFSDDPYNQFRAMDGLVEAHSSVGRIQRSLDLLTRRLELARSLNDTYEEFLTVRAFAEFYDRTLDKPVVAREFYIQAADFADRLGEDQSESTLRDRILQLETERFVPLLDE
ncbi:MAG: tetratricopeptide repeat protein [Cyanobacteria bacterium P01_H01_bin.121]